MVDATATPTPGLSFLGEWKIGDGTLDIGGDSGDADSEADIADADIGEDSGELHGGALQELEADLVNALQDVPLSTDRNCPKAMVTQDLSQQRSSRACPAEAFEVPVEQGTAKAIEKVPPGPEKKSPEAVVPQDPSQQRLLSACPRGSPAAAKPFEEPVAPGTAKVIEKVQPGPEKWSTEAVASSPPAKAQASTSEEVVAAAMGAMVPQGPLQKQPKKAEITLPSMTMDDFRAAFEENVSQSGKTKKFLGEGSEGVVNAALHKQTGTLRAIKWCKRIGTAGRVGSDEMEMLRRLARTRGLGRLIGCIFRRIVVKHVRFLSSARPRIGSMRGVGGQRPIG